MSVPARQRWGEFCNTAESCRAISYAALPTIGCEQSAITSSRELMRITLNGRSSNIAQLLLFWTLETECEHESMGVTTIVQSSHYHQM